MKTNTPNTVILKLVSAKAIAGVGEQLEAQAHGVTLDAAQAAAGEQAAAAAAATDASVGDDKADAKAAKAK